MSAIEIVAKRILSSDFMLITAGAGMGVDSGLPDFRGPEGFWKAYPVFKQMGRRFEEMSNPQWFQCDPTLAWGFFGHRYHLYEQARPHEGYLILKRWRDELKIPSFVFTSNVDGLFLKAGFLETEIEECHGSLQHLQCMSSDCAHIHSPFPAGKDLCIKVNMETIRADADTMPKCPFCGRLARPNVLMFGDGDFVWKRQEEQERRTGKFLGHCMRENKKGIVIELGAGKAVPRVRHESEIACRDGSHVMLVRVNPRDADISSRIAGAVSLPMGAKDALVLIDEAMQRLNKKT